MKKDNMYSRIAEKNLLIFAKKNGIFLRDLEETMCVSRGYFSRLRKGSVSCFSLDGICNLLNKYGNLITFEQIISTTYFMDSEIAQLEEELKLLKKQREAITNGDQHGENE